jgi:hypothetical protein
MLPAGQNAAEALYRIAYAAYYQHSLTVTSNIRPSKAHMFGRTCQVAPKGHGFTAWDVASLPAASVADLAAQLLHLSLRRGAIPGHGWPRLS